MASKRITKDMVQADQATALRIVALTRATAVEKKKLNDKDARIAPGAYSIAFGVNIAGDITVGAPVKKTVNDYDYWEILCAILHMMPVEEHEQWLTEAVELISMSRTDKSLDGALAKLKKYVKEVADKVAGELELTTKQTAAGSTDGAPDLVWTGSGRLKQSAEG